MRIYCKFLLVITFVQTLKVTDNSSNLFCAPQCRLPSVGDTFCRQISVLLQCRDRHKNKTSTLVRNNFQCGCQWLSTLGELKNNSHISGSTYFINCQKISELCCDKFKQLRQSYRKKATKFSKRLFNFTNDNWINDLTRILKRKQQEFRNIHGRHQRKKARHKLASFLKDAILAAKNQTVLNKGNQTNQKNENSTVLHELYKNSTGHFMHFGSEVFNLAKPEWFSRFTKYVQKVRNRIESHKGSKVRKSERQALEKNVRVFLLAVQKENKLDHIHYNSSAAEHQAKLSSPVAIKRTTIKQQSTSPASTTPSPGQRKTTKVKIKEATFNTTIIVNIGTTLRPNLKTTVSSRGTSSPIQGNKIHLNKSDIYKVKTKAKAKSHTKHRKNPSRYKQMRRVKSHKGHVMVPTTRKSPKADETKPIGYDDAEFLSDKWLKLYTQLTYDSGGWKNVKEAVPNNKITTDDIIETLRKRQKPIFLFIGIVCGLVILIICLLWTKKKVDDRKLTNSANIQQLGDLDLLIQQKKGKTCWQKFCGIFKRKNAEYIPNTQPVVLYPDIKTMKKTAYQGQSKPIMGNWKNPEGQGTSESEARLRQKGSEEDVAGESYRMFHYRMMQGFNTEIDGHNRATVKASKSQ